MQTHNNNNSNNNNNNNNRNHLMQGKFVDLSDYLTPIESDSTCYLSGYSTIKHAERLLKEYAKTKIQLMSEKNV